MRLSTWPVIVLVAVLAGCGGEPTESAQAQVTGRWQVVVNSQPVVEQFTFLPGGQLVTTFTDDAGSWTQQPGTGRVTGVFHMSATVGVVYDITIRDDDNTLSGKGWATQTDPPGDWAVTLSGARLVYDEQTQPAGDR